MAVWGEEGGELPRARAAIERGIRDRLHLGAQVYASIRGVVRADFALGEARPGLALGVDSVMLWMSAVKPVTAAALLQQCERGRLQLDDPVCRYIAEFAAGGKSEVTLRHVLTHTGGFPRVGVPWSAAPWQEVIAEICAAPLEAGWVPGERCAYHVASGWYVLAEVIRRVDGREYRHYVREEIFEPLGMTDSWVGMPEERHRCYGDRIAPMYATESAPVFHPYWPWTGSAEACALCRPGGSAWGPARELGRFYESLLPGGGGRPRILREETVAEMIDRHTTAMFDETFHVRLDRGLGVVLDSKRHGRGADWYGPRCSENAFGHGGYRCSVGFADPAHHLVVVVLFNGMPGDTAHEDRMRSTLGAIYEDLGLGTEVSGSCGR